jgi:hypothetical protein
MARVILLDNILLFADFSSVYSEKTDATLRDSRLQTLEEEQEQLIASLVQLTTHFAQVRKPITLAFINVEVISSKISLIDFLQGCV